MRSDFNLDPLFGAQIYQDWIVRPKKASDVISQGLKLDAPIRAIYDRIIRVLFKTCKNALESGENTNHTVASCHPEGALATEGSLGLLRRFFGRQGSLRMTSTG